MAIWDWQDCYSTLPGAEKVATIKCLESVFANAVRFISAVAGVAVFIMLLVGGFNFLFSGGDQKKLEQAKQTITHAFIGLVILVSAYLVIKTIQVITGFDLTHFSIEIQP